MLGADVLVREALGLFGATIAQEYGGLGLSTSTYAKIIERVSAVWMSVSGIINSHLIMAASEAVSGGRQKGAILAGACEAVIAALRAGSAERAESAMRLHVLTARDYLIEVMRERD